MNSGVINKEYIIFDLNAVIYLKNPLNSEIRGIVEKLRKKYEFPYCDAHLIDLTSKYDDSKKNLVENDINSLGELTNQIGLFWSDDKPCLIKKNLTFDDFQDVLVSSQVDNEIINRMIFMGNIHYDITKVVPEHPFTSLLDENGILTAEKFNEFLRLLMSGDMDIYKNIRKYVTQIEEAYCKNKTEISPLALPFVKSLAITDIPTLKNDWFEICKKWLSQTKSEPFTVSELLNVGYMLLDLHPEFNEKLKRNKNSQLNIMRDIKVLGIASNAKFLVTEDGGLQKKGKFLCDVFNFPTQILSMSDFTAKFS